MIQNKKLKSSNNKLDRFCFSSIKSFFAPELSDLAHLGCY